MLSDSKRSETDPEQDELIAQVVPKSGAGIELDSIDPIEEHRKMRIEQEEKDKAWREEEA